ncbi:MAG: MarR family winged helix-turn-helix transcriptional regulator [Chloroflexia bacterium]
MGTETLFEIKPDPPPNGSVLATEYTASRILQVMPRIWRHIIVEAKDQLPSALCEMGESQYHLVHAVHHKELTTGDLAEKMKVSTPTISRMVDSLVERGYLERRPDPADRRKIWLTLTGQGTALAETMEKRFRDVVAQFLEPLSPEQLEQIGAAFDTLETLLLNRRSTENKHNREDL